MKKENVKSATNDASANKQSSALVPSDIRPLIHEIRGVQVMLDRDLAALYGVTTGALNQAVKRNIERFPERFMFQMSPDEFENWKSQSVISNSTDDIVIPQNVTPALSESTVRMGLRKRPFVFTEHGVTMLASVLHSETAVRVSIAVIDAFVAMRKALASMGQVLSRIDAVERRQITDQSRNEARFDEIFDAMQDKTFPPQKVFYDGQVYDAKAFATKYIMSAKSSILLIDNWVDVVTLDMLAKKKRGVNVEIVTSPRGNHLAASDIASFNAQYGDLVVRTSTHFHDRFVIIDDKTLYLFGASLKDLGKKCFAFTKLDAGEIPGLKARIVNAAGNAAKMI